MNVEGTGLAIRWKSVKGVLQWAFGLRPILDQPRIYDLKSASGSRPSRLQLTAWERPAQAGMILSRLGRLQPLEAAVLRARWGEMDRGMGEAVAVLADGVLKRWMALHKTGIYNRSMAREVVLKHFGVVLRDETGEERKITIGYLAQRYHCNRDTAAARWSEGREWLQALEDRAIRLADELCTEAGWIGGAD